MKKKIFTVLLLMLLCLCCVCVAACKRCEHTEINEVITKQPTCTGKGTKQLVCNQCQTILETKDVEPLGHSQDVTNQVTKQATCGEEGEISVICDVCQQTIQTIPIEKQSHSVSDLKTVVEKDSTCTEEGIQNIVCSKCNTVVSSQTIPAKGHSKTDITVQQTKEPTCAEAGESCTICNVCKQVIATEVLSKVAHKQSDLQQVITTPATCTEPGVMTTVCNLCHQTVSTDSIQPDGHPQDQLRTVTIPSTCTESGSSTVICDKCNQTVSTSNIPATGHSKTNITTVVTVEVTCTSDGSQYVVCNDCNQTIKTETVPQLGHSYGNWITELAPTEEDAGIRCKVCANDSTHVIEEAIPVLEEGSVYTKTQSNVTIQNSCGSRVQVTHTSQEYGSYTLLREGTSHTYNPNKEGYCLVCDEKYYSIGLTYELSEDGTYYIVSNKTYGLEAGGIANIPAYYNGKPVREIASEGFQNWWINSVTVPETIVKVGAGAFSGAGLKTVYWNAESCQDFNGRNWVFSPQIIDERGLQEIDLYIGDTVRHIPARMFFPLATDPSKVPVLKSVTFAPHSILQTIGDYAFYKTGIKQISIPDSVISVGDYAFYGTALTSLKFGRNLATIGNAAFSSCEQLASVTFGSGLTTMGSDCFNYCQKLTSIDLSRTQLVTLGADSFKDCSRLETVILPSTLTVIQKQAFYACVSLKNARLGSGLQIIGEQAFYGCTGLKAVTIPQSVTTLGDSAFENCTSLSTIYFNAQACQDLASGNGVFVNLCSTGITVIFGENVQHIAARLFFGTSNASKLPTIKSVTLNSSLQSIGDYAFFGVNVVSATYNGTDEQLQAVQIGANNQTLVSALGR